MTFALAIEFRGGGASMIDPAALRTIADALDEANQAAAEQLRGILNGRTNESPAETGDGASPATDPFVSGGTSPAASEQVPEATPDTPAAVGVDASPARASGTAERPKLVGCPECPRVFDSAQAVGVHRRHVHGHRAGQGPKHFYLCDLCPEKFAGSAARDVHRRTHPVPAKGKPVGDPPAIGFGRPD